MRKTKDNKDNEIRKEEVQEREKDNEEERNRKKDGDKEVELRKLK